ncbi:GtrA family protein [Paenibacillus sp. CC-CFT747]|nr:GtrA family protein [Paenibacillus sp. CC-CFT747]
MSAKALLARYGQFIKFNLVGLLNTAIDFVVFSLLVGLGVPYLASQCVSYGAGIVNSFLLNRSWTFRERQGARGAQAVRFLLLNAVTLGLSLLLLYAFKTGLGLHPMAAKVIVTIFTTLVNFAGSKLWVFRAESRRGG